MSNICAEQRAGFPMAATSLQRVFAVLLLTTATWACPHPEDLEPKCMCKDVGNGPMMLCRDIQNAEDMIAPIKSSVGYDMFALSIVDSNLLYIPSKIFKGTKYEKIRFANTQLMSLTDSDLAFEGLEDRLEELRVFEAHYVTNWDWGSLRNHRKLLHIDVFDIAMHSVDQELPPLDSLRILSVSKAKVDFLHESAFSKLSNLRMLVMKSNEISELSRSMLPDSAEELVHIDFSDNELVELPTDLFTRMPNLEELHLNNNKLVSLNEDTFQSTMAHLQAAMMNGNPFRCDCRLRWLVNSKVPGTFEATCASPEGLKGTNLKDLSNNQLWC